MGATKQSDIDRLTTEKETIQNQKEEADQMIQELRQDKERIQMQKEEENQRANERLQNTLKEPFELKVKFNPNNNCEYYGYINRNGRFHGKGELFTKNTIYRGRWVNGAKNGNFKIYDKQTYAP